VRISLADQLTEMPQMTAMPTDMHAMPALKMQPSPDCYWYPSMEAAWGNIETPQKSSMMGMEFQSMSMETPPDASMKLMMPDHTSLQQMYDDTALKADVYDMGAHMESQMLPHRLFDSTPEKSDQGFQYDSNSSNGGFQEHLGERSESPPSMDRVAPMSPRPNTFKEDTLGPLKSPSARFLATPIADTPKRQCYVSETPSPDRMHCSWMQPAMPYAHPALLGGLAWNYGSQAHDEVVPEFLPMMPCVHHESQAFDAQ
jgi:hypothetical protein